MSDVSVESDAEAPEYVGSIQPYMFEPTMSAEDADARQYIHTKTVCFHTAKNSYFPVTSHPGAWAH